MRNVTVLELTDRAGVERALEYFIRARELGLTCEVFRGLLVAEDCEWRCLELNRTAEPDVGQKYRSEEVV